jgi:peptidoglycan hydrolase-like protein with peptidoglycan-binding domain
MVKSMVSTEDNQLRAMVAFMDTQKLIGTLKAHDWPGFARRYNGPNFAANNYDGLLEHFFQRYADGDNPDPTVRAVQVYLTYRGFTPGAIDGFAGNATRRAIAAFQQSIGAAQTGKITDALVEQLSAQN